MTSAGVSGRRAGGGGAALASGGLSPAAWLPWPASTTSAAAVLPVDVPGSAEGLHGASVGASVGGREGPVGAGAVGKGDGVTWGANRDADDDKDGNAWVVSTGPVGAALERGDRTDVWACGEPTWVAGDVRAEDPGVVENTVRGDAE